MPRAGTRCIEKHEQMNLGDYIQSPSNKTLLVNFAVKQLQKSYPGQLDRLAAAIEMELDDAIRVAAESYGFWLVTGPNIADANIAIWKRLRPKVEKTLGGAVENPEDRLKEFLEMRGATVRPKEDPADEAPVERSMDFLEQHYQQSWH